LLWNYSKNNPNPLVVQFLLNHGVDPNLTGRTWLDEVAYKYVPEYTVTCDRIIAELLINAGSKYALDGLMECAINDKSIPEITDLLLRGAKPDIAFTEACEKHDPCDKIIAELLINAGSKYALDGLMKCAVNNKSIPEITDLLLRGAKPDYAFKVACEKHDQQLFLKLIQAGGNIDAALFWAAEYEDLSMVKEMLDKGARIRETEGNESNVAYSKNEELKSLVLNAIDGKMYSDCPEGSEGENYPSSIMRAAEGGDYSAVEFMLKARTDPNNWVNYLGFPTARSALEFAENNGHTDVAELLKKYGAKKPEK
jgi:hypothetical protein